MQGLRTLWPGLGFKSKYGFLCFFCRDGSDFELQSLRDFRRQIRLSDAFRVAESNVADPQNNGVVCHTVYCDNIMGEEAPLSG
jgi:hypothetical protein